MPLHLAETQGPAPPAAAGARPDATSSTPTGGRRLSIVDDNIDAARSLELFFRQAGFEVQLAHDGTAALKVVRRFQPDVAVLDIGLPHPDGYSVAQEARHERAISLIALTGYAPDPGRQSLFDHYFVKPVNPDELLKLLSQLGQQPSSASSPPDSVSHGR
jgi:DNA-binding response OmpR family regulator